MSSLTVFNSQALSFMPLRPYAAICYVRKLFLMQLRSKLLTVLSLNYSAIQVINAFTLHLYHGYGKKLALWGITEKCAVSSMSF